VLIQYGGNDMPKAYSEDLRKRAVALYKELHNYSEVARLLGTCRKWVHDMVDLEQTTGTLETKYENCGRPPILTEDAKNLMCQWLREKNDLTIEELRRRLAKHGFDVCPATVHNALCEIKMTHKKNDHRRRKKSSRRIREA
jgi:transposase